MLQPNAATQRPSPLTTRAVGDYRRVRQSAQGQAPAANQAPIANTAPVANAPVATPAPTAPAPLPVPAPAPRPVSPAAQPASEGGLLSRLFAWVKRLFAPAPAPTPTPTPTPNPNPTPVPGPSGIDVFFTNAYAGTKGGMTNEQVNHANEASTKADPRNPDKQLVAMIDAVPAGGTLDGAFFDIDVDNVVDAFARAAQRGVKVRLATETDYYFTPNSTTELRPAIQKLLAAGVELKHDARESGLMHDKFLIANGQSVWTGSYNITDGGSYRENNNAMKIDSRELAGEYQKEFDRMFVHGNYGMDTDNGNPVDDHPTPKTVNVNGTEITTYFSPSRAAQGGAKAAILAELANAQKSIQFLAFSYTDDEIGQAMLAKAQSGVTVEGVFEKSQAASRYSEYATLNNAEATANGAIDVRIDTNPALMHHKVIIVDDSTLIMGSFNFSASAQSDNNENMLVIKNNPELVAKYKAEFARVQQQSA